MDCGKGQAGSGDRNTVKDYPATNAGGEYDVYTLRTGGDQAHNNLQPYIVTYMWKRVS